MPMSITASDESVATRIASLGLFYSLSILVRCSEFCLLSPFNHHDCTCRIQPTLPCSVLNSPMHGFFYACHCILRHWPGWQLRGSSDLFLGEEYCVFTTACLGQWWTCSPLTPSWWLWPVILSIDRWYQSCIQTFILFGWTDSLISTLCRTASSRKFVVIAPWAYGSSLGGATPLLGLLIVVSCDFHNPCRFESSPNDFLLPHL